MATPADGRKHRTDLLRPRSHRRALPTHTLEDRKSCLQLYERNADVYTENMNVPFFCMVSVNIHVREKEKEREREREREICLFLSAFVCVRL